MFVCNATTFWNNDTLFQVELMKSMIKEMFGENPKESHSIARIINKQHLLRLKNLLKDPHVDASTVYGGYVDEDNL